MTQFAKYEYDGTICLEFTMTQLAQYEYDGPIYLELTMAHLLLFLHFRFYSKLITKLALWWHS